MEKFRSFIKKHLLPHTLTKTQSFPKIAPPFSLHEIHEKKEHDSISILFDKHDIAPPISEEEQSSKMHATT